MDAYNTPTRHGASKNDTHHRHQLHTETHEYTSRPRTIHPCRTPHDTTPHATHNTHINTPHTTMHNTPPEPMAIHTPKCTPTTSYIHTQTHTERHTNQRHHNTPQKPQANIAHETITIHPTTHWHQNTHHETLIRITLRRHRKTPQKPSRNPPLQKHIIPTTLRHQKSYIKRPDHQAAKNTTENIDKTHTQTHQRAIHRRPRKHTKNIPKTIHETTSERQIIKSFTKRNFRAQISSNAVKLLTKRHSRVKIQSLFIELLTKQHF